MNEINKIQNDLVISLFSLEPDVDMTRYKTPSAHNFLDKGHRTYNFCVIYLLDLLINFIMFVFGRSLIKASGFVSN